jgi:hypothetical protein
MADGSVRLPDFTIKRTGHASVYWEHLGMLDNPGYHSDWTAKRAWYADHGILPWTDGGGPSGTLVWSTERRTSRGIDAENIERLARQVLQVAEER